MSDSLAAFIIKLMYVIRAFQFNWNIHSCQLNSQHNKEIHISSSFLSGWYMLEMSCVSPKNRINCFIHQINKDDSIQVLDFAIRSGKVHKRLIRLKWGDRLALHFDTLLSLEHFKLVRVSRAFARQRMLTKLTKMHPQYQQRAVHKHVGMNSSLDQLWLDYCSVFSLNREMYPYDHWLSDLKQIEKYDKIHEKQKLMRFSKEPVISIILRGYNSQLDWLEQAIQSVLAQTYPKWELCIVEDASTRPELRTMLEAYTISDTRVKVVYRETNGHISTASNDGLNIATGEWVALLDHDDTLSQDALFYVVACINNHADVRMIYSDEDKLDATGQYRSEPYFKCDWNIDLFYSQNMFSHLGVYKADLLRRVGGFRKGFEGSEDYDVALRCIEQVHFNQIQHIPRILYHWRTHQESTASGSIAKPYAVTAALRALREHFARQNKDVLVSATDYGYRVQYMLPKQLPLVSIIIPTKNKLTLLKTCVESIVNVTSYKKYEIIIVDNGSDDIETLDYLQSLKSNPVFTIFRDDRPFNYSALNNGAAKIAKGSILALLNNDVEVISPDWLSEMVSQVLRPEIGVVGAKLLYPDNTIQHAGVILGLYGMVDHVHRFLPNSDAGYFGRAQLVHSLSAVTGACMVVRRSVYEEVGGLDEVLAVAFNDIDFCLKVRSAGYRNLWTPYALLYHHESVSRGLDVSAEQKERSANEVAYMRKRWGSALQRDPAYNPNLSLARDDFSLGKPFIDYTE